MHKFNRMSRPDVEVPINEVGELARFGVSVKMLTCSGRKYFRSKQSVKAAKANENQHVAGWFSGGDVALGKQAPPLNFYPGQTGPLSHCEGITTL